MIRFHFCEINRIRKSVETESIFVVARPWSCEQRMTANRHKDDGNVLEMVRMVAHIVNVLKATELHTEYF